MHTEPEQSGSYGNAATYSINSGLEDHFSTDFLSFQTTGYSTTRSKDLGTGLRYDISNATVRDSKIARITVGYLCSSYV